MVELWDIYDGYGRLTGHTVKRCDPLPKDGYHLVVHVCIFDRKGRMLIQQRQFFKAGWPNQWDLTIGGAASSGEDSRTAAQRELKEELGLSIDMNTIRPKMTLNTERSINDFFMIEREVDIGDLQLQYEEVQAVRWATLEEVLEMIDKKEFLPYYPGLIRFLFESRTFYSFHTFD
ncbi:MAG: NUDIX domain-containing protein [Clostridiales bacterium]|nr:NUDIX domain-containing protein [Clostridiales bacterium]